MLMAESYSARSASSGSTLVARRAGIQQARVATTRSTAAMLASAIGSLLIEGYPEVKMFGILQTTERWASVTFMNAGHAMRATIDLGDPKMPGSGVLILDADGHEVFKGLLPANAISLK